MKKEKTIDKVCIAVYSGLEFLSKLFLVVMTASVLVAVFGRYIFHKAPSWSEELAIICIVWLCMLSAQIGVYDGLHIRMTLIENILPEKVWKTLYNIAELIPLAVNVLLLVYGTTVAMSNGRNRLPSSGWPMLTEYLALIISGAAGVILSVGKISKGVRKV